MVCFLFFGGLQEGSLIPFHQQILEKFMGHMFLYQFYVTNLKGQTAYLTLALNTHLVY